MENNNILLTILAIGLVVTASILAFNAKSTTITRETANGQAAQTISVTADSKLTVVPDKAEIYFRIITDGNTAIDAQDKNKQASNSVINALKTKGVADADIETTQYSINKQYDYGTPMMESSNSQMPVKSPQVKGYEVVHVLKISTKDVENVGSVADLGVSSGANNIDNILFTLSDAKEKDVKAQVLSKAASAAKEKANNIASGLGVSVGKLVSVSESSYNYIPYSYGMKAMAMDSASPSQPTQINPANLEVTATVSVSYEIK